MDMLFIYIIIALCAWIGALHAKLNRLERRIDQKEKASPPLPSPAKAQPPAKTHAKPATVTQEGKPASAQPPQLIKPALQKKPSTELPSPEPTKAAKVTPPAKPTPAESAAHSWNLEKLLLGNIFNKLGAIALIIAAAIFIKLISPYFEFTPLKRVISVFVLGIGMLLTSIYIHRKEMPNYAAVLMGTGLAVLFVAAYGGASYYQIIPPLAAVVIGIALVLLAYCLSRYYQTFSTLVIGLLGGYLTPFIIDGYSSTSFLFGYFIFLNALSMVYTCNHQSKVFLNYANLALCALIVSVYSHHADDTIAYYFPIMLWAVYAFYDFWVIRRAYSNHDKGLCLLNFAVLVFFTQFIFSFDASLTIGLVLAGTGVVYAGIACFYQRIHPTIGSLYFSGSVLAFLFATYYIDNDTLKICAWAVEALALASLSRVFKQSYLAKWALTALLLSFTALLILMPIEQARAFVNSRAIQILTPTLCALAASLLLLKQTPKLSHLLQFLALGFFYLYLTLEIHTLFGSHSTENDIVLGIYTKIILAFSYALSAYSLFKLTRFFIFQCASYFIFASASISLILLSLFWVDFIPFFNVRALSIGVAITASLLLAMWNRDAGKSHRTSHFFTFLALSFAYWLLLIEICMMLDHHYLWQYSHEMFYVHLIIGYAYALSCYYLYMRTIYMLAKAAGYSVFVLVTGLMLSRLCYGDTITHGINLPAASVLVGTAGAIIMARWHHGAEKTRSISYFFQFIALTLFFTFIIVEFNAMLPSLDSIDHLFSHLIIVYAYALSCYMLYSRTSYPLFKFTSYCALALSSLLTLLTTFCHLDLTVVVNMRFVAMAVATATTYLIARWQQGSFLQYLTLLLGGALISSEVYEASQQHDVLLSISWTLYAAVLISAGIFNNAKALKNVGIWLIALAGGKFIFIDLSGADAVYRTLAFLSFGIILMGVSYYYTKKLKK